MQTTDTAISTLLTFIFMLWSTGECLVKLQSVGPDAINRSAIDILTNVIFIPDPYIPINLGVARPVHHFRFYAARKGDVSFQVWRKINDPRIYSLSATTDTYTVSNIGINDATPTSPMTVQDGDVIAFYAPAQSIIPFNGRECVKERIHYKQYPSASDLLLGSEVVFTEESSVPCRNYSLQVVIDMSIKVTPSCDRIFRKMHWIRKSQNQLIYTSASLVVKIGKREMCAARCQEEMWCQSFTFSSLSGTCWMNDVQPELGDQQYENEEEAEYYIPG